MQSKHSLNPVKNCPPYWVHSRGRADCENRIKELKYNFGLDSFVLRQFWATDAALSLVMLAYDLMSIFRQAVIRQKSHQTLSTLHHTVLAMAAYWEGYQKKPDPSQKPNLIYPLLRNEGHGLRSFGATQMKPLNGHTTSNELSRIIIPTRD
jgi:hypothetical protein